MDNKFRFLAKEECFKISCQNCNIYSDNFKRGCNKECPQLSYKKNYLKQQSIINYCELLSSKQKVIIETYNAQGEIIEVKCRFHSLDLKDQEINFLFPNKRKKGFSIYFKEISEKVISIKLDK